MDVFQLVWGASLVAGLLMPLVAILVYTYSVIDGRARIRDTIIGYVLGTLLSGFVPGFLGMYAGAFVICAVMDDRKCGVGGAMIGAPLGAAIGMGLFIYFWSKCHPRPNPALTDARERARASVSAKR